MFDYLVHDIKKDYGELFHTENRTLLNVIHWCLRKNMVQQAVTLYSERMADEFVKQKVIYFSPKMTEWKNLLESSHFSIEYDYLNGYLSYFLKQRCKSKSRKEQCQCIVDLAARQADKDERKALAYEIRMDIKYVDKKDQVANCLINYYEFKRLVRHSINHASTKPIKANNLKRSLILSKEVKEKIKSNNEEIGIDEFILILNDIIEQNKRIGMN